MGWLSVMSLSGHRTPKAYLDAQFTWSNEEADNQVLRSSVVGRVYYAAVERVLTADGVRSVFAVICLFRYTPKAKDGYIFASKDMDETVGPYERRCPAAILDLLTPTDYEYAIGWRADCRANLAMAREKQRRPRPKEGDIVVLAEPVTFRDGASVTRFQATRAAFRRNLVYRSLETGSLYRFGLAGRDYQLNPAAKEEERDGQASLNSEKEPVMTDNPVDPLTVVEVALDDRANFLPKLFGSWYLRGEMAVYSFMEELCRDYRGGFWDFFEVSNGARFLAPKRFEPCDVYGWGNGFSGTLTPQAAGIVTTMFALSHLSFSPGAPRELAEGYERLYEYAMEHPEADLIFGAID
ncbi:antirestriction protein [Asticcacaulis sp. W401b]|uniref:antirestriction protein n=1 Tax=Asticcacaulis sp. W401b TaxID=3388666 RepID=UPI0039711119